MRHRRSVFSRIVILVALMLRPDDPIGALVNPLVVIVPEEFRPLECGELRG